MKVTDVLNEALSGYRAQWRYLGVLSLVVSAAVVLFSIVLVAAMGEIGVYAAVILTVVGTFWITALLVQTVHDLEDDDDAETWLGARFARFWPHVNRVSAAALLLSLLFVPGWLLLVEGRAGLALLLVLVGVVVSIWLVLAVPLIVVEGYSVGEAFAESRQLVAGNALKVFGALFVVGFVTGFLGGVVERIALNVTDSWAAALIASGVVDALVTTPLMALVLVALYRALRAPTAAPDAAAAAA